MAFNRPPRIQPNLPDAPVEIPGPQDVPTKPSSLNILGIGLPLGAVLLTVVLMSSGGAGASSYLRFLPIMLATYLATGVTYVLGRRNYKRQMAKAKEVYRQTLLALEASLQDLVKQSTQALKQLYPSPDECLDRANRKDYRIGERRPHDGDFLTVRLGTGTVAAPFALKPADRSPTEPELAEEFDLASRLYREYGQLPDTPIYAALNDIGSLGVAGPIEDSEATARAIICNLATTHWPEEVKLGFLAASRTKDWQWLAGLPHFAAAFSGPVRERSAASDSSVLDELESELRQREEFLAARSAVAGQSANPEPPLPRLVLVFVGLDPDFTHPGLSLLLGEGRRLGAHGLFLTQRPERVPGQCGAVLQVGKSRFLYQETGASGRKSEGTPDRMQLEHANRLASALAAIDWPEASDAARPPDLISMLELFGAVDLESLPIEQWWDGNPPFGYLRAPIGRTSATADLIFDLNDQEGAHGPHGLIGGMTGSGKSEILKTILLALAATHSPQDLNFALIDYKGGAAFNELSQLPHTVGMVTDIETHATYAERVILALTGEIEHRKRVLERARLAFGFGRSHIDEYRQLSVKRPLPRLVIVFDEFAEFKGRHPEESKRLIGIARQGRSLGVHLILATQNIEAAVDPEILQNSTFRICLRVSQTQDSIQMIGIPDAVNLTRGRAFFRAQSRQQFQGAYSGGFHRGNAEPRGADGVIRIDRQGGRHQVELPGLGNGRSGPGEEIADTQPTEAQALVDRILLAARRLRIKRPAAVWPDPLSNRLYLPELIAKHFQGGWDGSGWRAFGPLRAAAELHGEVLPVLGLYDDPARQRQVLLRLDPERVGHNLLVFGSAGTGKSTLLRTLISSVAQATSPDHAQFYVLDFGGSAALKLLEAAPHVGAVVTRFEEERVIRLIRYVQGEISRRSELLRSEGVDNYRDFNARTDTGSRLPVLFLVIDGFGEFKRVAPPDQVKAIGGLVAGGAAVGVRTVISANLQSDVPNDVFANIGMRLTFHQADPTEYYRIVGRPSEAKSRQDVENPPPSGRGLMRGNPPLEFQAALPGRGETEDEQARSLSQMAAAMRAAWDGPLPAGIRALPMLVSRAEVQVVAAKMEDGALRAHLGLDFDTLSTVALDQVGDGPGFLVAGTGPQSGKTTTLRTWILDLASRANPDHLQFAFLDHQARTLGAFRSLPHRHAYVGSAAGVEDSLSALQKELGRRQAKLDKAFAAAADDFDARSLLDSWPHVLIVIDDYDRFSERANEAPKALAEMLSEGSDLGFSFLVAGNASELPKDFDDPFMRSIRRLGCGVLLTGTEGIEQFNNARRPPGQPASGMPPGRGYLIRRGTVRLFHVAAYWSSGQSPEQGLSVAVEEVADAHS